MYTYKLSNLLRDICVAIKLHVLRSIQMEYVRLLKHQTLLSDIWHICVYYFVYCAVDESRPELPEEPTNPRDPRSYAQWWPLRLAKPCQKRNPPRYFRVNDVLSLALHLAVPPPAVQKPTLDSTSRGRFPKEFAINASSPHCASICFRLSTRGRHSHSVVVETNIRVPTGCLRFPPVVRLPEKMAPDRSGLSRSLSETGYDATFRFLRTFPNADSLTS